MNNVELLTWIDEATALWLLIPVGLAFIYLRRRLQGNPGFTERDWLFLFGHSRKEVFSLRVVLRFAALWFAVVIIGFAVSFHVLPYGVGWFAGAVVIAIAGILLVVPRWLG
jgi:hypothetical protein